MDVKIKILIASVLKPVDDVRAYQKIGRSLAQTNKYDVNIIGFNSKMINKAENISIYPIYNFQRNAFLRITASWKYYKTYLKVKPELVIVSSPELLLVNYLIKILFGTKILYDVQENYRLNIKHGTTYSSLIKPFLSLGIRAIEWLSRYFVSGYILAEKAYEAQLPFLRNKNHELILNKTLITESKANKAPIKISVDHPFVVVYSGTIGEEYGTLEAIQFCQSIYQFNKNIQLIITGYSPDLQYLKRIEQSIESCDFIQLKGGKKPIPHQEIINELSRANLAIMPYHINENLKNRIPTKFYECLALSIPMVIPANIHWQSLLAPYPAAISVDFDHIKPLEFLHLLNSKSFYHRQPDKSILWENEEIKLIDFLSSIILK
ncbi:hypothetical protein JKA74_04100 [Marivirga sp. S37H4]|uniref:Glycosyl transferase family 1 domain-containing protein n=1 Tax=Marivirga aurantiaca TaxID=2802615 RepID=A0A934WW80_9BACT|nr:hypothetical protein [Marivirga aurantiaca]MBK6264209.1 hypothetical protein [Marivirga aurantiaca]